MISTISKPLKFASVLYLCSYALGAPPLGTLSSWASSNSPNSTLPANLTASTRNLRYGLIILQELKSIGDDLQQTAASQDTLSPSKWEKRSSNSTTTAPESPAHLQKQPVVSPSKPLWRMTPPESQLARQNWSTAHIEVMCSSCSTLATT